MSAINRFHEATDKSGECWLWTNALDWKGYARFRDDTGRKVFVHRFAYEHFVGPIAEGLTIDHLCRVRNCVRPEHLEAVTNAENIARGTQGEYQNAKTHCKNGHEYSSDNTYLYQNERHCRICKREAGRRADAKRSPRR